MNRKILSYFLAIGLVVLFAGSARGYPLTAALNSMQTVPQNNSTAHGSCTGGGWSIDYPYPFPNGFDLNCEFSGLSGPLIDADIRLNSVGKNGDGVCNLEKRVTVWFPDDGSVNVNIYCLNDSIPSFPVWTTKVYYVVLQTSNFPDGEVRGQMKPATIDSDVDGEGRAEVSVFRPSDGDSWAYCSMTNSPIRKQLVDWQPQTDSLPFLADLDADGIADWVFIRNNAANGVMTILFRSSRSDQLWGQQFGNTNYGDMHVFGDYDGDGRIGVAVFRPSNGQWWIMNNFEFPAGHTEYWGQTGDTPCAGDYDGDGKTDLCVVRPESGQFVWYIRRSSDNQLSRAIWGLATDTIYPRNPADVDADGINDILVSRDENGKRVFYALRSSDNSMFVLQWGLVSDTVKIGDYDADGRTDFAAIREIDNHLVWFINQSSDGQMRTFQWGLPGDK